MRHNNIDLQKELSSYIKKNGKPIFDLNESIFLVSPKPCPMDKSIVDPNNLFTGDLRWHFFEVNDTYLELGISKYTTLSLSRLTMGIISVILFITIILPYIMFDSSILSITTALEVALYICLIPIAFWLYTIIEDQLIISKQTPIRFHRQRREVCYLPPDTNTPITISWEKLIAWTSSLNSKLYNPNSGTTSTITNHYLNFAFQDKVNHKGYLYRLFTTESDFIYSTWQSIYQYMEMPKEYWPEKLPMLSGKSFNMLKKEIYAKSKHEKYPKVIMFFYYIYLIATFWKLPFWVAYWMQKLFPMRKPSIMMEQWSQSIPEEQWLQPSPQKKWLQSLLEQPIAKNDSDEYTYQQYKKNKSMKKAKNKR